VQYIEKAYAAAKIPGGFIKRESKPGDFETLTGMVATLEGGFYANIGSAVILPEVFLKAISPVRNLGHKIDDLTTVNMDFNRHYRSFENVVKRPTLGSGRGFQIIGHHEIMFPLLVAGILARLEEE
jgi:hypothetical protein